jgi:hypothetical protein
MRIVVNIEKAFPAKTQERNKMISIIKAYCNVKSFAKRKGCAY